MTHIQLRGARGPHQSKAAKRARNSRRPWWQVMCLSGVDYYSTLGYQPGIAVLAAGALAPIATVFLILLTLVGAVPVYRRIAQEAPGGQGSIAVLARQLSGWKGKLLVLVLLGFVCTDFVITITLSSADATAHLLHSSQGPWNLPLTCLLIVGLALVFLRGFNEAIGISVVLVSTYLLLNLLVIGGGVWQLAQNPSLLAGWWQGAQSLSPNPVGMALIAALVFPKIALGLSGFETGVSVIPQIAGENKEAQLRGAKRLLTVSAVIMCVMLAASSIVVTTLVPLEALQEGGSANGRALAWLAHEQYGPVIGRIYDYTTVAILWFAGASAMAGMLNLIPKYLPKFGMAPAWVARQRPLVFVVLAIGLLVTVLFRANVDAQSGAYATGVLVLLFSGALASTLVAYRRGHRASFVGFTLVSIAFAYTAIANMFERPEGLHVASFFIVGIVVVSVLSRISRTFELRSPTIDYDPKALKLIDAARVGSLAVVAHRAGSIECSDYERKEHEIRVRHAIPENRPILFLEVGVRDASDFFTPLRVTGCRVGEAAVLRTNAAAVPNAIAAIAVDLHKEGPVDLYFSWSPGNPVRNMLRYLFIGQGQNSVVVHEILRRAYPGEASRPHVHVG